MKQLVALGIAAMSLSACGGGGSGGSTDPDSAIAGGSVITAGQTLTASQTLNDQFVAATRLTIQTDLPNSGSANYSGSIGFDISGAVPGRTLKYDAVLVGDLSMDVNFGGTNQPITGSVSNTLFADANGSADRPDGTLNISGRVTSLARSGLPDLEGVIAADATGTLTINQSDGAGDKDVAFDLDLSGQFVGDSTPTADEVPTAMRGFVVGTGSGGGLDLTIRNGRFAAERPGVNVLP